MGDPDTYSPREIVARREAALKKKLAMPSEPHTKKKPSPEKRKAKKP